MRNRGDFNADISLAKQLRSQKPLRTASRQKSAQDVHWWFGFGIERLIFNSLLSSPSAILLLRLRRSEIDAPPLIVLRRPVR